MKQRFFNVLAGGLIVLTVLLPCSWGADMLSAQSNYVDLPHGVNPLDGNDHEARIAALEAELATLRQCFGCQPFVRAVICAEPDDQDVATCQVNTASAVFYPVSPDAGDSDPCTGVDCDG